MNRVTIGASTTLDGVGLFLGTPSSVHLRPAPAGTGILIRKDGAAARATVHHVGDTPRARHTSIDLAPGKRVMTIEHLMSAIASLGITDIDIDVEGDEIPIGDGSCAFILEALAGTGLVTLDDTLEPIVPLEPMRVEDEAGARIDITPADRPEYVYALSYLEQSHLIPDQTATWAGDAASFAREIAPARTFCLEAEAIAMRAQGLFAHLTPRDMLVIGDHGPIDNAYRFPDEPARHKLLDLIGDLALAGAPIQARIVATRAGHALNHQAARALATLGENRTNRSVTT